MSEQTTALAMPRTIAEVDVIERIGTMLAKANIYGASSIEQGQAIALHCSIEGITPIDFKRTYHMFNGNLTMRADAMLATFNKRGGKHVVVERTAEKATIQTIKDGIQHDFSITWEEIQHEPFVFSKGGKAFKHNWATPRARMQSLWARLVSDTIRVVDPGVCAGVYTPEETEDSAPADTPAAVPPMTATEPPKKKKGGRKAAKTAKVIEAEVIEEKTEPVEPPPAEPEPPAEEPPANAGMAADLANVEADAEAKLLEVTVPRGKLKGEKICDLNKSTVEQIFEALNAPDAGTKYPEYGLLHREAVVFALQRYADKEGAE